MSFGELELDEWARLPEAVTASEVLQLEDRLDKTWHYESSFLTQFIHKTGLNIVEKLCNEFCFVYCFFFFFALSAIQVGEKLKSQAAI